MIVRAALLACAASLPAGAGAADGAALFEQHCAACHQSDGSGTVGLAPPLKGAHWSRLGADRGYLPTVVLKGLAGPLALGHQRFVGSMPGFSGALDDAAVAAVSTHVRTLQGAAGDTPYDAAEIAPWRQQAGGPPQSLARRAQALGQ